jgi:hypothetical protein
MTMALVKLKSKVLKKILKRINKFGYCVWHTSGFGDEEKRILACLFDHKKIEPDDVHVAYQVEGKRMEIIYPADLDLLANTGQSFFFFDISRPVEGL